MFGLVRSLIILHTVFEVFIFFLNSESDCLSIRGIS